MTVATVSALFEKISQHLHVAGAESEREQFARLQHQLLQYSGMGWDLFLTQLAKVKKPVKTAEEKEAEKRAKAEQAAKAKEEKKAAADAKKAEEKQRKADEKTELKRTAESQKAAEKQRKSDEAVAAKERAKEAKAQEKLDAEKKKQDELADNAQQVANELKGFVDQLPGGKTTAEELEKTLEPLKHLDKQQLMIVAKALDSDGGLTEKSTKAKIAKQLETNIRRLWKTSHNVLH
jgi:membrane protein involved in colicin uptake